MTLTKPIEDMFLHSRTLMPPCLLSTYVQNMSKAVSTSRYLKVFSDDEKGIVCYRTQTGEIICEGRDEGPYFDPPEPRACSIRCKPTIKMQPFILREDIFDLKPIEYMGSLYYEGRDEG